MDELAYQLQAHAHYFTIATCLPLSLLTIFWGLDGLL